MSPLSRGLWTLVAVGILTVAAPTPAMIAAAQVAQSTPQPDSEDASFLIGPEDVLGVVFWREPDLSGDVTVRPDGFITLPLVGEIQAAGQTPGDLRLQIAAAASKFIADANVAVIVRTIKSRRVFVTGKVTNPGGHPLVGPMTVLQAIALAGGLTEYADAKNITILRNESTGVARFKFNYKDVSRGKKLEQNILLHPGDTVVVP